MPWDRVHDEAEVLEHYISEELEELIAAKLGDPERDPHGDPIPTRARSSAHAEVPLAELEPGDRRLHRVSDSDAEMLRFLDEREIARGGLRLCARAVRAPSSSRSPAAASSVRARRADAAWKRSVSPS